MKYGAFFTHVNDKNFHPNLYVVNTFLQKSDMIIDKNVRLWKNLTFLCVYQLTKHLNFTQFNIRFLWISGLLGELALSRVVIYHVPAYNLTVDVYNALYGAGIIVCIMITEKPVSFVCCVGYVNRKTQESARILAGF